MPEPTESDTTKPAESRARLALGARIPVRKIVLLGLALVLTVAVVSGSWATISEGTFTGNQWKAFIVAGLSTGSLYALIALGYTLVYGILFIINFAHGEVFMAGAFASFFVARDLSESGFLNESPILAITVLLLLAGAVSAAIALILEKVAYRPLRGAPRLVPLITAIGASLFIQYTFRGLFGPQTRGYAEITILNGRVDICV